MFVSAALSVTLALAPIEVRSAAPCPTAAEIETRLQQLGAEAAPSTPPLAARVEARGAQVHLSLRAADGAPLGDKVLDAGAGCEALAETAAVLFAAWAGAPPPAFDVAAPPLPRAAALQSRARRRQPPTGSLAATFGSSWVGETSGWAAGAALELRPGGGRLGVRLSGAFTQPRGAALGNGREIWWQRSSVALGPQFALSQGTTWVELHAAPALSLVRLEGRGFPRNEADQSVRLGAASTVRATFRSWPLWPLVELGAALWPGRLAAYEEVGGREIILSRYELWAAIGVGFGR